MKDILKWAGITFADCILFGLSCFLPAAIAVPLCIFFGVAGITCGVIALAHVSSWGDEKDIW